MLARTGLSGGRARVAPGDNGSTYVGQGVLGLDVAPRQIERTDYTVVQVLFDDDEPDFDRTLLEEPMVAELRDEHGDLLVREPFDHEQFRQQLLQERQAGESVRRGVLVLTDGELPPAWIRLAFLPVSLDTTSGATLEVRRTSVTELRAGVEQAYAEGRIGDAERHALLTSIDQRHPSDPFSA